jgi:hypothetical protein
MSTVLKPTVKQLRDRRAKLLDSIRLSEEDLRERARRHELTSEEYYALETWRRSTTFWDQTRRLREDTC